MRPRRVLLERGEGEEHMARDWDLLERVARGETPFDLRFYLWSRPAISHGWGLGGKIAEVLDPEALFRDGVRVVERPTGGGLLYHGPDLSFGLAVKPFPGAPHRVAEAVARGLSLLGVPARVAGKDGTKGEKEAQLPVSRSGNHICFAYLSPGEVSVGGRKIVGLARRRVRGGILFQGSVYLRPGPERILSYLGRARGPAIARPDGGSGWPAACLEALVGRKVIPEEVAAILGRALEELRSPAPGAQL